MVLVEVVERVGRLQRLVRLERVAGLEIGVLHGRDPAGPGEIYGKRHQGVGLRTTTTIKQTSEVFPLPLAPEVRSAEAAASHYPD